MSRFNLRHRNTISYYEPEEPNFDDYIFCNECSDYVYEYCSIHGGLLVVPDDEVPEDTSQYPSFVPRAALTIPQVFLYISTSTIPGAGAGVYACRSLPAGIRFGPYRGRHTRAVDSDYCWQIYKTDRKPSHVVDGLNKEHSNWMRYVNCSRHTLEQNVVAFQYKKEIYYRTLRIIPKNTELLVYYGPEFAQKLGIDVHGYNTNTFRSVTCKINAFANLQEIVKIENLQADNTRIILTSNNDEQDTIPIQKLLCDHCNINYKTKPDLIQHIISFNIFPHNYNKNAINNENRNVSKPKNNENSNKEVDNVNDTLIVKRFDDKDREDKYKCDYCNKVFPLAYSLTRHIRIHTDKQNYSCNVCQCKFTSEAQLNAHVTRHGQKNYECDILEKKFAPETEGKIHVTTHTSERPYKCDSCNKTFSTSYKLKLHIRTHTDEKNYTCNICNRNFKDRVKIEHIRSHTGEKPYQCDICDSKFRTNYNLKIHMRIHTGEKPYDCSYCGKKFRLAYFLKCHLITHTRESPYICEICGKIFTKNNVLKRHTKTHIARIV